VGDGKEARMLSALAAFEQPGLFVDAVRSFFRLVR
jgi:hypothetical protein